MSDCLVQNLMKTSFSDLYVPRHQNGPDYELPATECRTWSPTGTVKIPTTSNPMSVVTFFRKSVEKNPNKTAMVVKRNGIFQKWTFAKYLSDVELVAKGFIKLGLEPFNGVCILGFNSPEWVISHLGAIFAGGLPSGIYITNSPAACFHVLNDCDANIVVVENEMQLEKILKIRDTLPNLKAIIQYCGNPTHPDVISWSDLLKIGESVSNDVLVKRIRGLAINQCCMLIYTSGTTGNPKGVMLSHNNISALVKSFESKIISINPKKNLISISYLPLSHLAALAVDLYCAVHFSGTVHFATPDALKGKMVEFLREVEPTVFLAVPRVLEKIYEKVQNFQVGMKIISKFMFKWAQNQAVKHYTTKNSNKLSYNLAKKLVLNRVKSQMGLQNISEMYVGGAPMATKIKEFFLGLDILILDIYGLSESCGLHVGNSKDNFKLDSIGNINSLKEHKVRISDPSADGNGEIMLQGANIFMGYLKLEAETKKAITEDQWLYTGDLGTIDENGYLYITGRAKELIITAGGENIPPLLIEDNVKENLSVISNCVLIGDKRKYLAMLITLKTEIDPETLLPTDQLTPQAISWCRSVGSNANLVSEILQSKDEKVMRAIEDGIRKYNDNDASSNAQKVQKWIILPKDFSISNGEFGPTGKMRRPIIEEKYSTEIEEMYNSSLC